MKEALRSHRTKNFTPPPVTTLKLQLSGEGEISVRVILMSVASYLRRIAVAGLTTALKVFDGSARRDARFGDLNPVKVRANEQSFWCWLNLARD
jgi:hypothetical protein